MSLEMSMVNAGHIHIHEFKPNGAVNVYGLENLMNLGRLPATGATIIALPMKIAGGSGAPVRVIALLP
jgi:kynurenine formamidase